MRKNIYTKAILLCIILCFFPTHGVFAAENTIQSTGVEILNMLIKIASRGRTIPAVLAGKLMSNDFVYATGLGLDKTLFTMWNYMKNFANFTLGFMLVFKIAKSLFTKDAFSIKKEIPSFFLAGILINMSWFLMGTMIDISNVATAAVGSFPQQLISESIMSAEAAEKLNVTIPDKICVNLDKGEQNCGETFNPAQRIDRIRARFNDMSGPLLYLGASIYRFQEYGLVNNEVTNLKDVAIGTVLKLIMLLMFIAPIIALFVVNLKRIFYLWLWIVFSPIIVLGEVLKIEAIKKIGNNDMFSMKEILGMIFQPVFVIGGMAIVLILSISMYSVMGGTPGSVNKTEQVSKVLGSAEIISAPGSSTFHNTTNGTEITFIGDIFRDVAGYAGGLVGYLIITLFVIMLLRAVVKMSTSSSKIASGTFDKITGLGKDLVMGANIIPMGNSNISLASMKNTINPTHGDNFLTKGLKDTINNNKTSANKNLGGAFYNSSIGKGLQKIYGKENFSYEVNPSKDVGNDEINTIQKFPNNITNTKDFIGRLAQLLEESKKENKDKHITLQSSKFKDTLFQSITNNSVLERNIKEGLGISDETKLTKDMLFDRTSDSSKKFIQYLQKGLAGEQISQLKDFTSKSVEISTDFTLFGGVSPTEPQTTTPTPPPTPPTST